MLSDRIGWISASVQLPAPVLKFGGSGQEEVVNSARIRLRPDRQPHHSKEIVGERFACLPRMLLA